MTQQKRFYPAVKRAGFSAIEILVALVFVAILASGVWLWQNQKTAAPSGLLPTSIAQRAKVTDTANSEGPEEPSRETKPKTGFPKRQFTVSEPFFDSIPYPEEVSEIPESDLLGMNCSPYYTSNYGDKLVHYNQKTNEYEELTDPELLKLADAAATTLSVEIIDGMALCETENGRKILEYEEIVGAGGDARIHFATIDAQDNLRRVTTLPPTLKAYFVCRQPLQITKDDQLFYQCGAGDGGYSGAWIYRVDLNVRSVEEIINCSIMTWLEESNKDWELECKTSSTPPTNAVWHIYRNSEYRFELKYPPGFYFREISQKQQPPFIFDIHFVENQYEYGSVHYPEIAVAIIKTDSTPEEWVTQKGTSTSIFGAAGNYHYYEVKNEEEIKLGDVKALQFDSSAVSSNTSHTLVQQEEYLIDIRNHRSGMGAIPDEVYKQIRSTLKFLD